MPQISINGRKVSVDKKELSYADLVGMAYSSPSDVIYTIAYVYPSDSPFKGGTVWGDRTVKIVDGMMFTVIYTGHA